jgi:hypothetical protein
MQIKTVQLIKFIVVFVCTLRMCHNYENVGNDCTDPFLFFHWIC